ncbi:MAG: hypothetical protein WD928_05100 [Gammaproteobacteria bacterium]
MTRVALRVLGLVWQPLAIGVAALAAYAWVHHTIVSAERARAEAEDLRVVVAEQARQAKARDEVLERARSEGLRRLAEIEAMRGKVNALRSDKGDGCRLDPDVRRRLLDIR